MACNITRAHAPLFSHHRICARESQHIYPFLLRRTGFIRVLKRSSCDPSLSPKARRLSRAACFKKRFLKVRIGGQNDQVDRYCLCLGRRNFCAGHVTRAASSAGQHDYANPPRMRRGYAHDQWQMRDHVCPPPCPPQCRPRISQSLRRPAAAISALILRNDRRLPVLGLARCRRLAIETA
jgi:hypothetical protein